MTDICRSRYVARAVWRLMRGTSRRCGGQLIGRSRERFARANHGEAANWVKFFNEDDLHSMINTIHTVLAQPKHRDDESGDRVDGEQ
jgi:hypothetical protein